MTFNAGSTLDISGSISTTPELLMTYGGVSSGAFTNVFDNGSSIPATDLRYSGGSVEVATAWSFVQRSGNMDRHDQLLEPVTTGPTARTTAFPAI